VLKYYALSAAGVLLRGRFAEERGEGLFRDKHGNRRGVHENRIRQREARRVRSGSRGPRRSAIRQAQQRRCSELRYLFM